MGLDDRKIQKVGLVLLVISSVLLLDSCRITKRKYLKGFYVHHNFHLFKHKNNLATNSEKTKKDTLRFGENDKTYEQIDLDSLYKTKKVIFSETILHNSELNNFIVKAKLMAPIKVNRMPKLPLADFFVENSAQSFSEIVKRSKIISKLASKEKMKEHLAGALFFIGLILLIAIIYFFLAYFANFSFLAWLILFFSIIAVYSIWGLCLALDGGTTKEVLGLILLLSTFTLILSLPFIFIYVFLFIISSYSILIWIIFILSLITLTAIYYGYFTTVMDWGDEFFYNFGEAFLIGLLIVLGIIALAGIIFLLTRFFLWVFSLKLIFSILIIFLVILTILISLIAIAFEQAKGA